MPGIANLANHVAGEAMDPRGGPPYYHSPKLVEFLTLLYILILVSTDKGRSHPH